ncbi:DUF4214 domain-containing protein [Rugamonas aquatica]|uniref:DUF4214 domain-containing protein n=1 Tax=Rugamonas aquatica TaxID=2743357 RepID=A0A6A7NBG4_9BURK|nr:DUF4214 domain-containing protein [Rugamonas aquatica]MQA42455.1 DUF4214 domain-containing protein [Rugamonas aquatica]
MPAPDNIGDTPATSASLAVGGTTKATFDAHWDRDMFKVDLQAGVTYVIAVSSAPGDFVPMAKTSLHLGLDRNDLASAVGANSAGPALEYTPAVSGTYYALVNYDDAQLFPNNLTYSYQISAAVKQPDALPANIHTPGVLAAGGSVSSRFDVAGDIDWFKFHATPGQHYAFTFPASSLTSTSMQVYSADGQLLDGLYEPFEPMTSGDYFVAVGGNVVGDYTLQSVLVNDDYSANGSSAGQLAAGGQVQGRLNYVNDRDCFHLTVQAGQTYALVLNGDPLNQNELRFEIADEHGSFVAYSDGAPETVSTHVSTFTAASSGTYAITVASLYPDAKIGNGSYTLKASVPLKEDHGDSPASATTLPLGTPVHGVINSSSDLDVFKLAMEAGVTYGLEISGPSVDAAVSQLRVIDQNGDYAGELGYIPYLGYGNSHSFTPATTGNYYFEVSGRSGTDYQLKASVLADDYHADAGTTGKLATGGSAAGTLERAGDHDWFALDMTAGMTYHLSLQAPSGSSLFEGNSSLVMNVFDAQGKQLTNTKVFFDAAHADLYYVASHTGTYYVDVGSLFNGAGDYVLQASARSYDTTDQPDTAKRLMTGSTTYGMLEVPSERDMYKFATVAGMTYAFRLEHKFAGSATAAQAPDLTITDAQLAPLGVVASVNGGSYQVYTAQTSGDIYLNISEQLAYPPVNYTLSTSFLGKDDYGNTQAGALRLSVDSELQGKLNYAGDIDVLKVTLQAGSSYQFDLRSNGLGGLDPHYAYSVALYDDSGALLQSAGSSVGYRAATAGNYYVAVRADTADANAVGGYTLKAATLAAAPKPIDALPHTAPYGLSEVVAFDFDEKVKVADIQGIKLSDAAGHVIALDEHSLTATADYHLALRPLSHLAPGTSYTIDIAPGAISDLAGNVLASGLHRSFTTVAATGAGTAGNDILIGKANGAAIHGGAGTDTVVYAGNAGSYSIVERNGHAEIKSVNGGGTDILDGVERLLFDDKTIALDIDGVGGKAYRLYQAAFNRAPDESGLGYWISNMDKGLSLQATAGFFIGSEEFGRRYGADLSDADFVTQLYSNVLHRAPDAAGHAYWLHDLQIGVARGNVLANFSESPENQAALIQVIGNGFSYIPYSV